MSLIILSPVNRSEPELKLGPEVAVLADGFPQFLTDLDQTLQGHSLGHGKCPGKLEP